MACFVVPGVEAIVTTIVTKELEKKEQKEMELNLEKGANVSELQKERFSAKLKKLNYLLYGGSGLLAFEHLWHGEIEPFFPFLTAARNPLDIPEVLHEMSTVGVGMAVLVTAAWGVMTYVSSKMEKTATEAVKEK
ncbi:MAG: hypothetical protein MJ134_08185 [Lachnospiraceae bacterium]|nr:hypothetical protein [Lachnospiraceae bacterium]